MIYLTVKEKEKHVLKLRKEENKTYKQIAHELRISPREISRILKEDNGKEETKERKKIVLSKTTQTLQLFKRGKSPIDVAIKLDLNLQEVQILYHDYLISNDRHHFVQAFKEFDNDSLRDLIEYDYVMKENGIGKKETIEGIKKSNDYPKIKDEHDAISNELKELKRQRDDFIADNKSLMYKNYELNKEYNLLVPRIESAKKQLQLTKNELIKKRELLDNITNSEDYTILEKKAKEQLDYFLNQKNEWLRLAITLTLDTIKDDPEKDILIYNILYPNENTNSGYFPLAYEEKIAKIVENLHNIILEINTNNMLN